MQKSRDQAYEAANAEAKSGAAGVDPALPYEYVTAAWARGEDYPIHPNAPAHLKWAREVLRGLTYEVTDTGPQRQ